MKRQKCVTRPQILDEGLLTRNPGHGVETRLSAIMCVEGNLQ